MSVRDGDTPSVQQDASQQPTSCSPDQRTRRVRDCDLRLPPPEEPRDAHEAHELDKPQEPHNLEEPEASTTPLLVEADDLKRNHRDQVDEKPRAQIMLRDHARVVDPAGALAVVVRADLIHEDELHEDIGKEDGIDAEVDKEERVRRVLWRLPPRWDEMRSRS